MHAQLAINYGVINEHVSVRITKNLGIYSRHWLLRESFFFRTEVVRIGCFPYLQRSNVPQAVAIERVVCDVSRTVEVAT
jgi:hypothetical protein